MVVVGRAADPLPRASAGRARRKGSSAARAAATCEPSPTFLAPVWNRPARAILPASMTAPRSPETHCFGPFRLDVGERQLLRDGRPVALRAKVFETLVVLVRRAGRLVTREELIAAVWPDAI